MRIQEHANRFLLGHYKRRKRAGSDLSLDNCLRAARETATRTKYCFLITHGDSAWPSARLVEPICDPETLDFFVGTHPASRKAREIAPCPKVTLAFGNKAENANLIAYGTATLSTEPELKRRYWKSHWRLFFPGGPGSEDYAVMKVRAERLEVLSFKRNVIAEPFGLRPMVLERAADGWNIQAGHDAPDGAVTG